MMRIFTLFLLVTGCLGTSRRGQPSASCETAYDMAADAEEMFQVFVRDEERGVPRFGNLIKQRPTAPHGVIHDNGTCVRLRRALAEHLELRNSTLLDERAHLYFFRFGDYLAVLSIPRRLASDQVVVSGTAPLYVFERQSLKFVAELRF